MTDAINCGIKPIVEDRAKMSFRSMIKRWFDVSERLTKKEYEKLCDSLEYPEVCSNCGEKEMFSYFITALSAEKKEMVRVVVRQCDNCRKLSSIASRAFADC